MRGQIIDTIYLPFLLFMILVGFALVGLIAYKLIPPILEATNQTNTEIGNNVKKTPNSINYIVWGLLIGSVIMFIGSALFIRSNPVFFGISLLMLIFAVYFAMSMSNISESFTQNQEINNTVQSMSALKFISDNLVMIVAGVGLLVIILTYIVFREPENGGGIGGI